MLRRKISNEFALWKASKTTQGLLVTGARQVGKTYAIEDFAREHYGSLLKIDFVELPQAVDVITAATDTDDLIRRMTVFAKAPLIHGDTLVFFDEIQECKDAITWMKYLSQDSRFDVVYSGSMLGVEAFDYRSLPVGYADVVEMFPLDFQEFCWAFGVADELWDTVHECFQMRVEVPDYLHDRFIELFNLYVLVGGMPDPLWAYSNSSDTRDLRKRQKSIVSLYRKDITRYVKDPARAQRIKTIFQAIPAQLNKENKRFVVSDVGKQRFESIASDFDWLVNAGVALSVKRSTEPTFPAGLSEERSMFKLYQSDVGLLFSQLSDANVRAILQSDANINYGSVYENAVAQELLAHGHTLRYYKTSKFGEVDFLLEYDTPEVTLVEVKSGKQSARHKALNNLMDLENYAIKEALVLHKGNVRESGRVTYLPVYMAAFL